MTRTISTEEHMKDHQGRDLITVTFDDGGREDFIGIKRVQHEDIGKAKTPGFVAVVSKEPDEFDLWWLTEETNGLDYLCKYYLLTADMVPRITVLKPMFAGMPVGRG